VITSRLGRTRRRPPHIMTMATLLAAALIASSIFADSPDEKFTTVIDWSARVIRTRAEIDIRPYDEPLPVARRLAMLAADAGVSAHLFSRLATLPVDSSTTMGDLISVDPTALQRLSRYVESGTVARSFVSPDLTRLVVEYEYEIHPTLASLAITHSRPTVSAPYLGFSPSTRYSGLVIYARGEFPVHGESARSVLTPALKPRIFDESMRLLYSAETGIPEILLARGAVTYSQSTRLTDHRDLVGEVPLVTMARSLFGTNRTDIIIPDEVAERIRAEPANRQFLAEGRIVVICDLP
jgi:hypothetical protein